MVFSAFRVGKAEAEGEEAIESVEIIEMGKQEEDVLELNKEASEEPLDTEREVKEADYYLPYPGILPDHPLYWLKMFRDKVLLFLTRKPVDRYERLLLYADKRVGAAEALIKGGKVELGVTTADKAEKYMEQAISELSVLAKEGKATPEMQDQVEKAAMKHLEVLEAVLDKVPDQSKPTLEQAIEKTKLNYEKVISQFD